MRCGLLLAGSVLALGLASGCQRQPSAESQRLDRLDLKIQQLEQRLNKVSQQTDGADRSGKPPAGVIKSLTLRMAATTTGCASTGPMAAAPICPARRNRARLCAGSGRTLAGLMRGGRSLGQAYVMKSCLKACIHES